MGKDVGNVRVVNTVKQRNQKERRERAREREREGIKEELLYECQRTA